MSSRYSEASIEPTGTARSMRPISEPSLSASHTPPRLETDQSDDVEATIPLDDLVCHAGHGPAHIVRSENLLAVRHVLSCRVGLTGPTSRSGVEPSAPRCTRARPSGVSTRFVRIVSASAPGAVFARPALTRGGGSIWSPQRWLMVRTTRRSRCQPSRLTVAVASANRQPSRPEGHTSGRSGSTADARVRTPAGIVAERSQPGRPWSLAPVGVRWLGSVTGCTIW